MEKLEREQGWKEEEFDFVLQFLRTILLKRKWIFGECLVVWYSNDATDGASLIYTIPSVPSPLQTLIHSSLGIHSMLKKQPLKHNVIDRDKVVLPPNWDSWGKIRVLREGFDVEGVNQGWSIDIEEPLKPTADVATKGTNGQTGEGEQPEPAGAVTHYEETIHDPGVDLLSESSMKKKGQELDVQSTDA